MSGGTYKDEDRKVSLFIGLAPYEDEIRNRLSYSSAAQRIAKTLADVRTGVLHYRDLWLRILIQNHSLDTVGWVTHRLIVNGVEIEDEALIKNMMIYLANKGGKKDG
jgi:hypothetical protein